MKSASGVLLLAACIGILPAEPIRFRVTLDPAVAANGASGRLFVFLKPGTGDRIRVGFVPEGIWLAAREVPYWKAGEVIEFNPDELSYPTPFSKAAAGDYVAMALLDRDHSFARERQDAGDLTSPVVALAGLNPADAPPVSLTISQVTPAAEAMPDTANVKLVEYESALLTAFSGRRTVVKAGVVLPDGHAESTAPLPTVYHVHGFGGNYREAFSKANFLVEQMASGKRMRAVHVFLDANCPGGHHVFADSVNNGPWGKALTEEFIPHLEQRFRLVSQAGGRFLTGHSSGGWSALWLQVAYPNVFGGTWPTSPDAMDFRSFTGIDVTPASTQNAYRKMDGSLLNLVRFQGKDAMSVEEFAKMERVTGDYGGQLASFEWVFSPRGADGRPVPLFNRDTGETAANVREYWQRYDVAKLVRDNWADLGPKLRGKIRLAIGSMDNFHLNESAELFCGWMKEKGHEDACEIVPERDHFNLFQPHTTYPNGLIQRIDDEMRAKWESNANRDQPR